MTGTQEKSCSGLPLTTRDWPSCSERCPHRSKPMPDRTRHPALAHRTDFNALWATSPTELFAVTAAELKDGVAREVATDPRKIHFPVGRFCMTGEMGGCHADQVACLRKQWNGKSAPKSGSLGEGQEGGPVAVGRYVGDQDRRSQARGPGTHRSRCEGHVVKLADKRRREFTLRHDTQARGFGVKDLRRGNPRVQMLTIPLRQLVHDPDLIG